jgi:hypothetical protein
VTDSLGHDGSSVDHNALHHPATPQGDHVHRHTTPAAAPAAPTFPLEHVFRHAGDELIDHPDLPLPTHGTPWRWVSILWPDPTRHGGWGAIAWQPGERGWRFPAPLALGDVIEFGSIGLDPTGTTYPETDQRWHGWLANVTEHAAIVIGPYPSAWHAVTAAQPFIDEVRCAQLPDLDAWLLGPSPGLRRR